MESPIEIRNPEEKAGKRNERQGRKGDKAFSFLSRLTKGTDFKDSPDHWPTLFSGGDWVFHDFVQVLKQSPRWTAKEHSQLSELFFEDQAKFHNLQGSPEGLEISECAFCRSQATLYFRVQGTEKKAPLWAHLPQDFDQQVESSLTELEEVVKTVALSHVSDLFEQYKVDLMVQLQKFQEAFRAEESPYGFRSEAPWVAPVVRGLPGNGLGVLMDYGWPEESQSSPFFLVRSSLDLLFKQGFYFTNFSLDDLVTDGETISLHPRASMRGLSKGGLRRLIRILVALFHGESQRLAENLIMMTTSPDSVDLKKLEEKLKSLSRGETSQVFQQLSMAIEFMAEQGLGFSLEFLRIYHQLSVMDEVIKKEDPHWDWMQYIFGYCLEETKESIVSGRAMNQVGFHVQEWLGFLEEFPHKFQSTTQRALNDTARLSRDMAEIKRELRDVRAALKPLGWFILGSSLILTSGLLLMAWILKG